jgi:hypothetical protein
VSTTILAMAAALACAACSTGPLDAPTTATYEGTFTFVFTSSDTTAPQNHLLSVVGSMILTLEGTNGILEGKYAYSGFPAGSGTMGGHLSPNDSIAITQFGDPGSALGATMQFLHNNWPTCDFTQAQPAPFSGSLVNNNISLAGGLTVPCTYTINEQQVTLQTKMVERVALSPAHIGNGPI